MPVSGIFLIVGILLGITTLVGILGNFCVCLAVLWNRSLRTKMNLLLVNLAISDIGMSASCMPFAVYTVLFHKQQIGELFCHFNGMMITLFAMASVLIICAICVYQYTSIVKPFDKTFTNLRCLVMVLCAWLIAFFLALGPAVSWGRYEFTSNIFNCEYFHAINHGAVISYNITLIICGYGFPLIIIIFSYISVFKALKSHKTRMSRTTAKSSTTAEENISPSSKTCMNIFIVVLVFLVCRTPFFVYLVFITKYPDHTLDVLGQLSFWAIFFHSACDPFVYALKNSDYQDTLTEIWGALRLVLRCTCCHKGHVTQEEGRRVSSVK